MSQWKTVPTLFGHTSDRPVPGDVPYGTQWYDIDSRVTYASDEVEWRTVSGGAVVYSIHPPLNPTEGMVWISASGTCIDENGEFV